MPPAPTDQAEIILFVILKSDQDVELRVVPLRFKSRAPLEAVLRQIHGVAPFGDGVMTLEDSAGKELRYRLAYFRGYYWTSTGDFVW